MFTLGMIDQSDSRLRNSCQAVDFPDVVHSEFDNSGFMLLVQPENRERNTDVVIQIARSRQTGFLAESRL